MTSQLFKMLYEAHILPLGEIQEPQDLQEHSMIMADNV